jgi:general secretion pathway protein G
MRPRRGFTLIEMMIVILVLAVLALIVGFAVRNAGHRAKESRKKEDVQGVNDGCVLFQCDTNVVAQSVDDLLQDPASAPSGYMGPYLTRRPADPYSNGDYVIQDGAVTGPADVTNYQS